MPSPPRLATRIAAPTAATFILLLPAVWNRFPLLQYDTGGYLARWFEGTLVVSRSTTYGLFAVAGWPLDFWPVIVLQAALAVWVVALLLRTHGFNPHPYGLPTVIAGLSVTTALPWLASLLLTDIFAGLGVLGLHALVWHGDRIRPLERAALVLFVAFAASTHGATFAVLLALAFAAVAVSALSAKLVPRRGLAHVTAAIGLGAAMLLTANYAVAGRLAWTPGGLDLLFGRMLQDGIVARYLNDHCPDPQLKLCQYRSILPRDADQFFWADQLFDRLGRFEGLGDEMRFIVVGSLHDYPLMQASTALVAGARQLVDVATGEGVVRKLWHTHGIIERYMPADVPAMQAARQQHGRIDFSAINALHVPVAWAAMALVPLLLAFGFRHGEFADIGRLAATVACALLANAAVCGMISNPHDRYGSRMVWIAAFVVVLWGWRIASLGRERSRRLRRLPPLSEPARANAA